MLNTRSILVALLLHAGATGCASPDETADFRDQNPTPYNQQIEQGWREQQAWTANPYLIVQHLFEPESKDGNYLFGFEQISHENGSRTIIVSNDGVLDDEVYGERHVLTFVMAQGRWNVKQVKVGYKCYPEDEGYSGRGCGR